MDYRKYRSDFDRIMGVKETPNSHDDYLFARAKKYCRYITWLPGIEMIAVSNSLSMYATHEESDIDLFIIMRPGYLWLVRVLVTGIFLIAGVWRKGTDIAGNFCLSFFITTEAMNLKKIAIQDDIYLYFWIYYLKPIFAKGSIYDVFLEANSWVHIDETQKLQNLKYVRIVPGVPEYLDVLWRGMDRFFRLLFEGRTISHNTRLGNPPGVIISDHMLKFHPEDRREEMRDRIFGLSEK